MMARPASVTHEPHVVGPMAVHVVLPWIRHAFANFRALVRANPLSLRSAVNRGLIPACKIMQALDAFKRHAGCAPQWR